MNWHIENGIDWHTTISWDRIKIELIENAKLNKKNSKCNWFKIELIKNTRDTKLSRLRDFLILWNRFKIVLVENSKHIRLKNGIDS